MDTTRVSDAPPGWTTPAGGGLHLITDLEFDDEGRTTQVLGPSHTIDIGGVATSIRRATWTVYRDADHQVWTGHGYATGTEPDYTFTLINPVSLTKFDADRRPVEVIQATRDHTDGALVATDDFPQSSYVRWTTYQYDANNLMTLQRSYHTIPASSSGSSGTNYDETTYGYDLMQRKNRDVSPGGTITRTVFDVRDNPAKIYVGTNDNGATDTDPTGGGAAGNNMVIVTQNEYDFAQAGGDNNLTQLTQYVDSTTSRLTQYLFDWRNRRTDTDGEIDFYQKDYFDNLDRLIGTERYDTTASGNLIARSITHFDDRNRVCQTVRYGIDPSTGTVGNSLTDNTWFDEAGNVIKSLPSGSMLFTKMVYDGVTRQTIQYQGYDLSETGYPTPGDVSDDTILEQTETDYDDASNTIQTTIRWRYHNATGTGALGDPNSAQPKARVNCQANWHDGLGQVVATANYGTNGGTVLIRPSTIPLASDTVLVTLMAFTSAGDLLTTTAPNGMVTYTQYDDAGREIMKILNYKVLSSSSSSSSSNSSSSSSGPEPCPPSDDTNVTILTAYNADGNVSSITAVNNATGNQVTQFIYGTTLTDSALASSRLKRYEIYPDSVSNSDRVQFQYNQQGDIIQLTDQNGTVHAYDFDLLGRKTQDRVTTLGTGIDGAVRRIATTYEVRGMAATISSYDNAIVGSGTIVNQVQLVYNAFTQLTAEYQEHNGAVNTSTTPKVQYTYADGSANQTRQTSMTYPNGRILNDDYGATGGIDDAASRIATLIDDDGVTHLGDYSYLGRQSIVETDLTQPGLKYTLIGTAGGNDPDTGDIYLGFDRFSRVKDLYWYNYSSSVDAERIKYGYDRMGNRTYRQNTVDPASLFDELYRYDGIQRVKDLDRGTLNAGRTAISSLTFAECWALDATGNCSNFRQDDDGDGVWDLNQSRTVNLVNEISLISASAGPTWTTPTYDLAGNMTGLPQPNVPTSSYFLIHDAWNRLVALSDGVNTVDECQYDGRNRRIVKKKYVSGTLSETRHHFYSRDWQVLEERIGTSSDAERQSVYGLRYLDDVLLRDRDTGGGELDERLYALQDANWNVTALANTTGTIQERYAYAAYGMPTFLAADFSTRGGSNFAWEMLFAGYRWESESGLYQVRNRWLAPHLGIFIQRDGLGLAAGTNLYTYVADNPSNFTDPSGNILPLRAHSQKGVNSGIHNSLWTSRLRHLPTNRHGDFKCFCTANGWPSYNYKRNFTYF